MSRRRTKRIYEGVRSKKQHKDKKKVKRMTKELWIHELGDRDR